MGFRIPAVIVSPYARRGHVDHKIYGFESILKLIRYRFGLDPLTTRDAYAHNIVRSFDFESKPDYDAARPASPEAHRRAKACAAGAPAAGLGGSRASRDRDAPQGARPRRPADLRLPRAARLRLPAGDPAPDLPPPVLDGAQAVSRGPPPSRRRGARDRRARPALAAGRRRRTARAGRTERLGAAGGRRARPDQGERSTSAPTPGRSTSPPSRCGCGSRWSRSAGLLRRHLRVDRDRRRNPGPDDGRRIRAFPTGATRASGSSAARRSAPSSRIPSSASSRPRPKRSSTSPSLHARDPPAARLQRRLKHAGGTNAGACAARPAAPATTSGSRACAAGRRARRCLRGHALPTIKHLFVLVLENENSDESFGPNPPSPYLGKTLPEAGALVPNYFGIGHASLDNYIAMISGQPPNPITQADCLSTAKWSPGTLNSDGHRPRRRLRLSDAGARPSPTSWKKQATPGTGTWRTWPPRPARPSLDLRPPDDRRRRRQHRRPRRLRSTRRATTRSSTSTRSSTRPACQKNVVDLDKLPADLRQRGDDARIHPSSPPTSAPTATTRPAPTGPRPGGYAGIDELPQRMGAAHRGLAGLPGRRHAAGHLRRVRGRSRILLRRGHRAKHPQQRRLEPGPEAARSAR